MLILLRALQRAAVPGDGFADNLGCVRLARLAMAGAPPPKNMPEAWAELGRVAEAARRPDWCPGGQWLTLGWCPGHDQHPEWDATVRHPLEAGVVRGLNA